MDQSPLTTADLGLFATYGIGQEMLAAAGVRRVTDTEARELWGVRWTPQADLSGLMIPYLNPLTGARVTARLRRDHPEVNPTGKFENKYLSVYGDNHHLYFPPGAGALLADPTASVVFVEAEKSSLAITALMKRTSQQFLVVATGGCWSWRGKVGIKATANGGREEERGPLSDLSLISWEQERQAIILFDSNTATNPSVRVARWAFAQYLAAVGAKVSFADIPHDSGANGPDDLIAVAGDEAVLALLGTSRPFQEQAEQEAQAAVAALSKSCDLEIRDQALDAVSRVADLAHQRVLAARASKALGERSKRTLELEIGLREKALREAREQAKEAVRQARLLRSEVEPARLIEDLEAFFRKRLALPDGATLILALFTMNTYVFDVFDATPYVQVDSAVGGCGKTTLLHHLEATCCRGHLGCDPTEAVLFRRIDRDRPTWLLDEASVIRGHEERARMIRAVLDAGYRKGATVSRIEGENFELRDFRVYCPKVFALVGRLRGTLLDRCIVIHLQKTRGLSKSKLKILLREGPPLREKLEAFAAQYRDDLHRLDENEPDEGYWPQLDGREEELWGPLLCQARLGGEDTERRALEVALRFSRQKGQLAVEEDQAATLATELIELLAEMSGETFSPGDLQGALVAKEAWGEKLASCKSDKARVCAVGRFLKNYRFPSRRRDSRGSRYNRVEAVEVIRRHLPPTDMPHATEAVKTRVLWVANPENGLATADASEAADSAAVATPGTTLASGEDGHATAGSRMNAESVAYGNSNEGGRQAILKF